MYQVNKKSWHYKWLAFYHWATTDVAPDGYADKQGGESFVEFYERTKVGRPQNFCMYWRHVLLWPLVMGIVHLTLWAVIIVSLWVAFSLLSWNIALMVGGLTGGVLVFFLAMGGLAVGSTALSTKYADWKKTSTAYKAYKEKHCPIVEYINE